MRRLGAGDHGDTVVLAALICGHELHSGVQMRAGEGVRPLCHWEDGPPASEVADALARAAHQSGWEGERIRTHRSLSRETQVMLLIAAAAQQPTVLTELAATLAHEDELVLSGGEHRRAWSVRGLLERCCELVQGRPSTELRLPVSENAHICELTAIVLSCSQAGADLAALPEALTAARAALTEV